MIIIVSILCATAWAVKQGDYAECKKWAAQAQQYPQFYLTKWQKEQCDYQGVPVTAPVL